jgi:hypothetical protein
MRRSGDRQGQVMRRSMLALLADDVSNPRVWAPVSLVAKAKGENLGQSPHAAVRIVSPQPASPVSAV